MLTRDDQRILEAVLAERGAFGHREHLELAWRYLGLHDLDAAQRRTEDAIRHVATSHGRPDRFHRTLTWAWARIVAVHRARSAAGSFDAFLAQHPALLDRGLVARHYVPEMLGSAAARTGWVEPDRHPFPPVGTRA